MGELRHQIDGVETSTRDLVTEVTYQWDKRFKKHGVKQVLPELRAELQRFKMTPEAIAQFNKELSSDEATIV